MNSRVVLATIAGDQADERLVVSIVPDAQGRTCIELSQQHHGEGVGWFDQRTMSMDARAWQALQAALGGVPQMAMIEAGSRVAPSIIPFSPIPHETSRRPAVNEG